MSDSKAFQIKTSVRGVLSPSVEESLGSVMHKALRYIFKPSSTATRSTTEFGIVGGKKYQMHSLSGAPICEYFEWREGSVFLVIRVVPIPPQPAYELAKEYQLELYAGSHLTLDPRNEFEVDGVEWKLVCKERGYRGVWNKFYYYKMEIERQNGISSVDGFIGEWNIVDGNIEALFRNLRF